jgi:transcriptional antiterminator RfaH
MMGPFRTVRGRADDHWDCRRASTNRTDSIAMPILKPERSVYPDDLLEHDQADGDGRQWWAVYTKARQEKALARELLQHEVPFYLPLVPRTILVRGRRVESLLPLFAGYVFLRADEDERVKALKSNRTSQWIGVTDQDKLRRDLASVNRLILAKAPITVEQRLAPGTRVRVKAGPFMGAEGIVEHCRGACRLIVEVTFLQQSVSVQIDELLVEKTGG